MSSYWTLSSAKTAIPVDDAADLVVGHGNANGIVSALNIIMINELITITKKNIS